MQRRYPSIRPYATHTLAVENPHTIYFEESGTPDGLPVIVVHGGPGAGSSPEQRRFFDPNVYRIILFDQRGCGQSTPVGCLENNNTQALIADMEAIRNYLAIDKWVLFGGSWGAALSLLYSQAHSERVLGLILRSVLLANQADRDWFFKEGGASRVYPYFWEEFAGTLKPSEREDIVRAYYVRLDNKNELIQMKAAKAWSLWHRRCATMNSLPTESAYSAGTMRLARLECHYFVNNCFIAENQIIDNMDKLKNIPGMIVHGRYDMITPLGNSAKVERAWKKAELDIVRDAGHASSEPALTDALIKATEKMAKLIGDKPKPKSA
jgi:proline iminopeptidase